MKYDTTSTLLALAVVAAPVGAAAAQVADDPAGVDAYQIEDSLQARVWLDRGAEAVVEPGDEVRVYYRTSDDAFAAIFRVDTDGRISLLYPQHPDVDPFVAGGRDYRLIFPDSPRWRVREDPGVGYFFMVASRTPLDFSAFGWDEDGGWNLSGVGETVYEDPYVAIDDYVAALLPTWQTTPYALDFLEYSVGEDHDYPRFLCYDCHGFRSYASWNPYDRLCSSYQVVIWDDPYFYPRFRYVGTRVVFARPLLPRPRYAVRVRAYGSSPGPVVLSRPAPPRRTAVYKESPRGTATVAPRRGVRPGPGAPSVAPERAAPSVGQRGAVAPRPSARLERPTARPPAARPPSARTRPERAAAPSERPTLRRRVPSAPPPRAARGGIRGGDPRGAPRPDPRVTRGSPGARAPSARPAPRAVPPRARPSGSGPPRARPSPRRPGGGVRPPAPSARPRAGGGGARAPGATRPPPPPRATPGARRPPPRAGAAPRRPGGGRGTASHLDRAAGRRAGLRGPSAAG